MTDGRAPRVLIYSTTGGPEFMLGYGPSNGPQLLVLQPLFEEMNRCRALVTTLCRMLAAHGIGCWLPDLPGTGESPRALETVGWRDWTMAVEAARHVGMVESGRSPRFVSIRGGALLDGGAGWRFSPVAGRSLLADLRRSAIAGAGASDAPAAYRLDADLAETLAATDVIEAETARTLRLASDDRPADRHIEGAPLWRRPEPGRDDALATTLSDDIADWAMA